MSLLEKLKNLVAKSAEKGDTAIDKAGDFFDKTQAKTDTAIDKVQEAAKNPDEMVEAARPFSGSGGDELIQQRWRELAQVAHPVLVGEGRQQTQRCLLGPTLPAESPFLGEEVGHGSSEAVVPGVAPPSGAGCATPVGGPRHPP